MNRSINWVSLFTLAVLLSWSNLASAQENQKASSESRQVAKKIEANFTNGDTKDFHFWQFTPVDYSADGKALPLIIFLHGRGECGSELALVKRWGPPKRVAENENFPFVVLSPQCPTPGWDTQAIKSLHEYAVQNLNVDSRRVYLTGLSMGGYGTWKMLAQYPDLFAAAVPICGGGKVDTAQQITSIPIWAFHGDADTVVPLSESQNMVDAIKEVGGENVKLTVYQGVGHNSWESTYANQEVYDWLLQHQLPADEKD